MTIVENTLPNTDDRDLERLFDQARRYPLLTAEQEREIDTTKWNAVASMQALLVEDLAARDYLLDWSGNSAVTAIDVSCFERRELHFVLRREMAQYMAAGKLANEMEALHGALQRKRSNRHVLQCLENLQLPASLIVGLTVSLMRRHGNKWPDSVADGMDEWSRHWGSFARGNDQVLTQKTTRALKKLLRMYSSARDKLTMHNLRLVYSIAGRHRGKGVAYLDLIQEGTLGLIRAAEKYDHRKGFRFSTYCFNWITQAVRRYVGDTGGLIRYPTHVQEQVSRLYRLRMDQQQRTGQEPTDEELAQAADLPLEKTRELLRLRNLGLSLDAPQYDDDDSTLLDSMSGGPFERCEQRADNASLHRRLVNEMAALDRAERDVVVARWGLHDGPPLSRAEIADRMQVSREWVRQLEHAALNKLSRNERIRSAFKDYVSAAND